MNIDFEAYLCYYYIVYSLFGGLSMKKYVAVITAFCILITVAFYFNPASKRQRIFTMVESNLEPYTELAVQLLATPDNAKDTRLDGVKNISPCQPTQVDFTCFYRGFGSQTSYQGFYYSADDTPRGMGGTDLSFRKQGKGLQWEEAGGDNTCYIEKIFNNWYYFEQSF